MGVLGLRVWRRSQGVVESGLGYRVAICGRPVAQ